MSGLQGFKSGRCPKCNSNEVYTSKDKRNFSHRSYLILSAFSVGVPLDTYVCVTCGYVEDYLSEKNSNNPKLIQKLKNKWRKVNL
jgi:predicted nucleic-acid-binding Zn-ribbon protein